MISLNLKKKWCSQANLLDHQSQLPLIKKRSPVLTKRSHPLKHRQPNTPPPMGHQYPKVVFQRDGRKNSGSTMGNNTLMGPCENPKPWQPTHLPGTHYGWLLPCVAWGHGTCVIFPHAFKQRVPLLFSAQQRCSRCWYGPGLNSEVNSCNHWQVSKRIHWHHSTLAAHRCGGRGLAMLRKTQAFRGQVVV